MGRLFSTLHGVLNFIMIRLYIRYVGSVKPSLLLEEYARRTYNAQPSMSVHQVSQRRKVHCRVYVT